MRIIKPVGPRDTAQIAIVAPESAVSLWHPELDPVDPADVQSNPTPGVHIA
ncbi:unnamed protein product [Penicillium camemberti]|uniref:Str. FM013 n=1 Tax=Penicillium camemberti (strain FM 013) TaxID=1429867 RepID=A0A0G4PXK5_PENC3|nr:unnamed protein product [Penicillium camemberti]